MVSNLLHSICNPATSCSNLCHKWSPGWSIATCSSSFCTGRRLHVTVQLWIHTLDDLWRWYEGRNTGWRLASSCPLSRSGTTNLLWCSVGGMSDRVWWWVMDGAKGSKRGCILHRCWSSSPSSYSSARSERLHAGIGRCDDHVGTRVLQGEGRRGASTVEQLRQTALDGVLLRGKASGAGDWLHPGPSRQLDLSAVKTLRYIHIEHSLEENSAL